MIFAILFVLWTCVLAATWLATRNVALSLFGLALVLSVGLFLHHMTDPLTLSF